MVPGPGCPLRSSSPAACSWDLHNDAIIRPVESPTRVSQGVTNASRSHSVGAAADARHAGQCPLQPVRASLRRSRRASSARAACARTSTAGSIRWSTTAPSRRTSTRSRRSRSSTSCPARRPFPSPRPAVTSAAPSVRTGRSRRCRAKASSWPGSAAATPPMSPRRCEAPRLRVGRLHLHRADHLRRVRARLRGGGAGAGPEERLCQQRLHDARAHRADGPDGGGLIDGINVDLKAGRGEFYRRISGASLQAGAHEPASCCASAASGSR